MLRLSAVNGGEGRGEVDVAAASRSSSKKKMPLDIAGLRPVTMVSWEDGRWENGCAWASRVAPC